MNTKVLAKVPLFHELPAVELELLASSLKVLDAPPGTVLFREKDPGEELGRQHVSGGRVGEPRWPARGTIGHAGAGRPDETPTEFPQA